MKGRSEEIEKTMAAKANQPGFASLLGPGVPAILWSTDATRVLWASREAAALARGLADEDGRLVPNVAARDRLRLLGGGLAPREGTRLEKLRFERGALAPPTTLACRLITLDSGDDALLTAFVGPLPELKPAPRPSGEAPPAPQDLPEASAIAARQEPALEASPSEGPRQEEAGSAQASVGEAPEKDGSPDGLPAADEREELPTGEAGQSAEPAAGSEQAPAAGSEQAPAAEAREHSPIETPDVPVAAPEPLPERSPAPVRFVWRTDAEGRFVAVSDTLAQIVGPESAAIVGLTLEEVLETRLIDPNDIILELFERRETWSGRAVHWRVDGSDKAIAVNLGGLPVYDAGRRLVGFRGFGLCRPEASVDLPPSASQAPTEPELDTAPGGTAVEGAPAAPQEASPSQTSAADIPDAAPAASEPAPETTDSEAAIEPAAEARTSSDVVAAEAAALDPVEAPAAGTEEPEPESAKADLADEPADGSPVEHGATQPAPVEQSAAQDVVAEQTPVADAHVADAQVEEVPVEEAPVEGTPVEEAPVEEAPVGDGSSVARAGASEAKVEADAEPVPRESAPVDHGEPGLEPESPRASGTRSVDRANPGDALSMRARVGGRLGDAHPLPLRAVDSPGPEAPAPDRAGTDGSQSSQAAVAQGAVAHAASRLTAAERSAFREIARALGARFVDDQEDEASASGAKIEEQARQEAPAKPRPAGNVTRMRPAPEAPTATALLDRLPIGVLVHRGETALFANRFLLDLLDYDTLAAMELAGGLARLFHGRPNVLSRTGHETNAPLAVATREGESIAVEIRITTCEWEGFPANLMLLRKVPEADPGYRIRALEGELQNREARLDEQSAILDTATDGVIVLDDHGRILTLNRSAEALFGYEQNEVTGEPLTQLLATESHIAALDYLEGLRENGVASLLNDGREVLGRVRQGGSIPLFMTLGRISEGPARKFCAVLRDITAFKKAEGELVAAKRAAERASSHKSDFLAKISHEIRTPLNAIIGFAEVMLEERFGPVGNERYRDYLSDIHTSGQHVISLVNDLLDLAKIEAGRLELNFGSVLLNELVNSCVALMQPQAARDRIVMRMSFAQKLPPIVADERSLRQIVLNILSNAVKFTDAGGQVIVSTAITERGEVVFRVRDTGIGMTETELEAALEPFRQLATSRKGGGTGLGLPLTKALVEANRAALAITSTKNEGTLVEVVFPPTRVLAE